MSEHEEQSSEQSSEQPVVQREMIRDDKVISLKNLSLAQLTKLLGAVPVVNNVQPTKKQPKVQSTKEENWISADELINSDDD